MRISQTRAAAILAEIANIRVQVVGDLVLDEHRLGVVARLSREAPLPVIEQREQRLLPGGAANLAVNLRALGAGVRVLGIVGDDPQGQLLIELVGATGVETEDILAISGATTPTKLRIWASGERQFNYQQVARIDTPASVPVTGPVAARLAARLRRAAGQVQASIFSDYEGGVVEPEVLAAVPAHGGGQQLRVADSHGGFERFSGFDALTPNQPEAESFLGRRFHDLADALAGGSEMRARLGCRQLLLTLGAQGMALIEDGQGPLHLPAIAISGVSDPSGAGDSVAAVFTAAQAAGASPREAAALANLAGAVAVSRIGVAGVTGPEILNAVAPPQAMR